MNELKDIIERFKLGRKICNEMVHDYMHKDNPYYSPEIHATRVDGINEQTSLWEGAGYLAGLSENIVKHPKAMYKIFVKSEERK